MSSSYPVLIVLVVILGLLAGSWFLIPKGPHQIVIRTAAMLTLTACYLLWMVTYMAQVHPLIVPKFTVKAA